MAKNNEKSITYRYTECGLDNVQIKGVTVVVDDAGDEVYCLPQVQSLHKAIAHEIITKESSIDGNEIRFLRTEMGMTQEELARVLNVARNTVVRWEKNKPRIDAAAEVVVRMLSAERLELDIEMTVESMADRCVWKAAHNPILIDGSDPEDCRPVAA